MPLQGLPKPVLSRREIEVAALVAQGLTNREIATRLFISQRTADGHLEHIREKLGMSSRAQVAAWFVTQSHAVEAAGPVPLVRDHRAGAFRIALTAATLGVLLLGGVLVYRQQTPNTPSGPIITTVVGTTRGSGSVRGGYSGDSGPATYAQLGRPKDLAVAPDGDLFIADTENQVIRLVDGQGNITTFAGGPTTPFVEGGDGLSMGIGNVAAVALSPDHVVYFSNGSFIARVDSDLRLYSVPSGQISTPAGLCFAPDGTLFIADTLADKVWRRTPDGALTVYAGTGTHGFFGDNAAALGAELSYPTSLALDGSGNLYIADTGNNRIRRVDAATRVIVTVAGSSDTYGYSGDGGPADKAELSLPFGVAVASNGDVYIADTGNNRVRRVDAKTNVITTIAGSGRAGFAGDGGAAVAADLYGPYAVVIAGPGDLYIVDQGNQRIRVIRGVARG
jgi:trimeric autotransporter adhesin